MAIGAQSSYLQKLSNIANFCHTISYPEQKQNSAHILKSVQQIHRFLLICFK